MTRAFRDARHAEPSDFQPFSDSDQFLFSNFIPQLIMYLCNFNLNAILLPTIWGIVGCLLNHPYFVSCKEFSDCINSIFWKPTNPGIGNLGIIKRWCNSIYWSIKMTSIWIMKRGNKEFSHKSSWRISVNIPKKKEFQKWIWTAIFSENENWNWEYQ